MAETGTDILKAAQLLCEGKLVAIPTETVYGLAANALDADACLQIYKAKNRPAFDPLIVHVGDVASVPKYVMDFPEEARRLCERFWPGPLTVVLPKKPIIPDLVTSGNSSVAIRVPSHPLTQKLLDLLDFPLAAPSANPFSYVSPTTAQHVQEQLGDRIDYILDGGPCQVGIESTIIRFDNGKVEVLRLGGTALEEIENITGKLEKQLQSGSNPAAPGQLDQHYSPHTRFVLTDFNTLNTIPENCGFLRFQNPVPEMDPAHQWILASDGNTDTAARNLFTMMREMDARKFAVIFAELVPEEGLGPAVNDRLRRAAAQGLSPE